MFFKKIIFTLISISLSLIIIIAGAEIILRVLKGVPDSPLALITQKENQRYLFKPGSQFTSKSSIEGEFEYSARINSQGYRGKEFLKQKPEEVTRVLFIGDSFTFGVGAEDDETFAALVENGLVAQGLPVEVINAGIGHISTIRHWDNLQKIHLRYEPDIVFLFFDLTDLWDDWHWDRHAVWDKKTGTVKKFDLDFFWGKRNWWQTLVHRSALAKYLQDKLVRTYKKLKLIGFKRYVKAALSGKRAKSVIAQMAGNISEEELMEYDALLMMRGLKQKDLIDKHWQRTTTYLTKIRDLLAERNIPFVIVMYPHGIYVGPDQWNEGRKPWGFEQGKQYKDYYPFELMEEYTSKENIAFINTLPAFLNAPSDHYFFDWDGHMTPKGNRIVAQQILTDKTFLNLLER